MSATAVRPALRLLFAGTPAFAAHHLQTLLDASRDRVIGVYTQPDRPAGRGNKLASSAVKLLAEHHRLPLFQPLQLKTAATQAQIAALDADLMVVVAYGLILPQAVLDSPRFGCINVHASLLPRWRGAAPIQRAILAGDDVTGISIMAMDAGLDTGPVLYRQRCPIRAQDTSASLQDRLAALGGSALLTVLDQIATGTAHGEPQNDRLATYAAKITKEEAAIDWSAEAVAIVRRVRALNPAPVAFTTIAGERLRIWAATARTEIASAPAGTVIAAGTGGIHVACGSGALDITELQFAGRNRMSAAAACNSRADLLRPGCVLGR